MDVTYTPLYTGVVIVLLVVALRYNMSKTDTLKGKPDLLIL